MRFGPVPLPTALGAVAAHSVRTPGRVIRKGTRLDAGDIAALRGAGFSEVVVATLEATDETEDSAAGRLAARLVGPGTEAAAPFTGRANLYATLPGVLEVDAAAVDAFNGVDEALTLATLRPFDRVAPGDMVATVKVIPYAVPRALVDRAVAAGRPLVRVVPFIRSRIAVISTRLPGLTDKVIDKTLRVTTERAARAGAVIVADLRVAHATLPLAAALDAALGQGADCILVFGASAIADRRDVVPAAVEMAGGQVERLGMPVDPGNLLMMGAIGEVPVLGAPGCARSPKENGFDWILLRVLAGLAVTSADVAQLGVGGLLGEIVTRPQPRQEPEPAAAPVAAVVMAAGRGTRMGGPNKLLETVGGRAVVRRVAEAALASRARPVIVVTGHDAERVRAALAGLPVQFAHNPDFARGMSTSVRTGILAVPAEAAGAVLLLGDMPLVEAASVDGLLDAFAPEIGRLIVVPVAGGRRGNPVLWSRRFFPELCALEGDTGARELIAWHAEAVVEVEVGGVGVFLDVDTPDALSEARAEILAVTRV